LRGSQLTHNGHPLSYVGLSAQKNYYVFYMMSAVGDPKLLAELQDAFKKADKKLDMGQCCVRFRKLEDLPLDANLPRWGKSTNSETACPRPGAFPARARYNPRDRPPNP
jgi:hypothetical protein